MRSTVAGRSAGQHGAGVKSAVQLSSHPVPFQGIGQQGTIFYMDPEAISVVIPTFNGGGSLGRAVASALAQSIPPLEIIVVDDASSDESTAEALRDPRLRVIRHAVRAGPAAARNTGIANARGKWVAFLDSDDEWAPRKLELQLATLRSSSSQMQACTTGYTIVDQRYGTTRTFLPERSHISAEGLLWGCVLSPGSTLMAARRVFNEVAMFDERLQRLEDWDWLMRFSRHHTLAFVSRPMATIYKNSNPSSADVLNAITLLRRVHGDYWNSRSRLNGRKFESSLLLEEAAAAYYDNNRKRAAFLLLRMFSVYPWRDAAFFAMVLRQGRETLAGILTRRAQRIE